MSRAAENENRLIVQMGIGQAADATEAAIIAIKSAGQGANAPILSQNPGVARFVVSLGLPDPESLDESQLRAVCPEGAELRIVHGGQQVGAIIVATAAVETFLPTQTGWISA